MRRFFLVSGITFLAGWLLSLATGFTLGGAVHVLLFIGGVLMVIWLLTGQKREP